MLLVHRMEPAPRGHPRVVAVRSINKDRQPRWGGCCFSHLCQVGGAAGLVLYDLASKGGQGILTLIGRQQKGVHGQFRVGLQGSGWVLGSLGQVSRVQGRHLRFWVRLEGGCTGLQQHTSIGVVRSIGRTFHIAQVPLAKQSGGLDTIKCSKKHQKATQCLYTPLGKKLCGTSKQLPKHALWQTHPPRQQMSHM
jgi:hypothetical protein